MTRRLLLVAALAFPAGAAAAAPCPAGMREVRENVCRHQGFYVDAPVSSGLRQRLVPDKPELDARAVELGRLLFFDPLLSQDRNMSCATCHDPRRHLTDGLKVSRGRAGNLKRNAPPLWNLTFKSRFFWDGRAKTLEHQALIPLTAPDEMAMAPGEAGRRVAEVPEYRERFQELHGDVKITDWLVAEAIADFERTLTSLNSRYDRYAAGDFSALSPEELKGLNVFRSFVSRCPECHTPPLFTNGQLAVIGAPEAHGEVGQEMLVPSLRNVAETPPYMHSGMIATLTDAVEFYRKGGGPDVAKAAGLPLHWHMRPMPLGPAETKAIVAFLETLTDETLLPESPKTVPSGLPLFP